MSFVQIIEYSTTRQDEVDALLKETLAATEGRRTATRAMRCTDRDKPNTYVNIVEFPSYEAAMQNSQMPETSAMAEQMAKLCDGPPIFRNLDVGETLEG
ncbi:MAG TPA: hypothetical protein VNA57_07235 [Acidimicrobiales bacterium]|nr:hypothetical protein [Acidimicrobiales bacterium]